MFTVAYHCRNMQRVDVVLPVVAKQLPQLTHRWTEPVADPEGLELQLAELFSGVRRWVAAARGVTMWPTMGTQGTGVRDPAWGLEFAAGRGLPWGVAVSTGTCS